MASRTYEGLAAFLIKHYPNMTKESATRGGNAFQTKKEKRKKEKVESKTSKFTEQYGQLGDRSRNLFEIRVPKIILRNLSFKVYKSS